MKTLNQTKAELKSYIINCIKDGQIDSVPVSEIHNELFNTDFYICGYYDAEQWLIKNGGIFNAIAEIIEYEKSIRNCIGCIVSRVCQPNNTTG